MRKLLSAFILLSVFAWIAPATAQVSKQSCDRDYDACKKKHIFDKKPCKKRRDNCFAQLAAQEQAAQKADVKSRMMNGVTAETPGSGMRNRANGGVPTEADKKAQALQRLKERQQAKSQEASGAGMREAVQSN